jgi:hypothetical protein
MFGIFGVVSLQAWGQVVAKLTSVFSHIEWFPPLDVNLDIWVSWPGVGG